MFDYRRVLPFYHDGIFLAHCTQYDNYALDPHIAQFIIIRSRFNLLYQYFRIYFGALPQKNRHSQLSLWLIYDSRHRNFNLFSRIHSSNIAISNAVDFYDIYGSHYLLHQLYYEARRMILHATNR